MGQIRVDGESFEIAGDTPTQAEQAAINKALDSMSQDQPAEFNAAAESVRATKIGGRQAGMSLEAARKAPLDAPVRKSQQFLNATRNAVAEFDRRKEIAESGVELNTEFPTSSVGIGFSEDLASGVQAALTKQFQEDGLLDARKAVVRYGPTSGKLEFQDPETGKFHLVHLDLLSKAGFALPMAGDIAGTIVGGISGGASGSVPGALLGETAGSAAGTAAGEALRLSIGRAMGFNELSTSEILSRAGLSGVEAGVITLGTGGLIVSGKAFKNFINAGGFTRKGALEAGFNTDEADAIIAATDDILNKGGSSSSLRPTTAQRAQALTGDDDVVIGSVEKNMRSRPEYAQDFVTRDAENARALREAFDVNQSPFVVGPNKGADAARDALEAGVTKRTAEAKRIVGANAKELDAAMGSLDKRLPQATGKDVRPVIEQKRQFAADAIDEANDSWRKLTNYDEVTGLTGVDIPISTGVKNLQIRLSKESQRAMTSVTRNSKSKLFGGKPKAKYDLADYNIALSDLKRAVRTSSKNGNYTDPSIGDMKLAIKEIEAARNKGLINAGRKDVLDALLDAEKKRAEYAAVFDKSMVGNILEKDGVGYKIKNQDIFREIFNSNTDDVDALIRVIGDDPQAMNAVREGIVGEYNRNVVRNGIPVKDRHDLFMETHKDVLSKFFNSSEMNTIQGLGKMGEVVTKQGKKLEYILKNAESVWGRGKLTSLDPEKMVDFIFNDSSVIKLPSGEALQVALKKTRWLKNRLKDNPAALRGLQANYANRIQESVIKNGMVDPKGLDSILKNEQVLSEFMGVEYVKNLKTIRDAGFLINKKFKTLTGDEFAQAAVQALRGTEAFAPLTKEGRRLTAGLIFMRRQNHKIIADALLNPEKLKDIAELTTHNAITRRTIELASSLGIILPAQDNVED